MKADEFNMIIKRGAQINLPSNKKKGLFFES